MFSPISAPIIRQRVPEKVNHQYDITDFGASNLYPQLMEELYLKSPLAKQAIKVLTEFSIGEGWTSNGDRVVNDLGHTFNDLLYLAAHDLNTFTGFSFHHNFNGLGRITEIQHVSFPYIRYGSKDLKGRTNNVKVFNNWEEDSEKFKTYAGVLPEEYPLFNPTKGALNAFTGGNGQIQYWTPRKFCYPTATFDAIRDAVQTDAEIQQWALKNIQNGFLGTTIFKFPGGFDSEEDKRRVENKVREMQGTYNANSVFMAQTPEDFTGSLIESIPAANNDALFNLTGEKVTNTILQNFGVPGPLLAVSPSGSVFTQEQIRDSYVLANLRTKSQRKILERAFEPIGKLFGVRLGPIKEIPWEIAGQNDPQLNGDPNQLGENENEGVEAERENRKAQANLRGSVGGVQGILQTQASVAQGITGYEAGVTILVEIYGFNDATARKLLGPKKALEEGQPQQQPKEEKPEQDGTEDNNE